MPHLIRFFANEWVSSPPASVGITSNSLLRSYPNLVTTGLHRFYGTNHLHFITGSCYDRQPRLHTADRRDLFLRILEEARFRYRFVVHGYVVMPEHFHLLITEPEIGDPSVVMKVVKERFSRFVHRKTCNSVYERIWQKRFYDFNVWSERKHVEKLRYMHRNPVIRGLVERPEEWIWSSFRSYLYGEIGAVRVNFQEWPVAIRPGSIKSFGDTRSGENPLIRKVRE